MNRRDRIGTTATDGGRELYGLAAATGSSREGDYTHLSPVGRGRRRRSRRRVRGHARLIARLSPADQADDIAHIVHHLLRDHGGALGTVAKDTVNLGRIGH